MSITATCWTCEKVIAGDIHYDRRGFCRHPECMTETPLDQWTQADMQAVGALLDGAAKPPTDADRERQVLDLRTGSPMRGRKEQHDASELALFSAANEPGLL